MGSLSLSRPVDQHTELAEGIEESSIIGACGQPGDVDDAGALIVLDKHNHQYPTNSPPDGVGQNSRGSAYISRDMSIRGRVRLLKRGRSRAGLFTVTILLLLELLLLMVLLMVLLHMERRDGESSVNTKMLLLLVVVVVVAVRVRIHWGIVIADRHEVRRIDHVAVNSGTGVRVDRVHHERVHHG